MCTVLSPKNTRGSKNSHPTWRRRRAEERSGEEGTRGEKTQRVPEARI